MIRPENQVCPDFPPSSPAISPPSFPASMPKNSSLPATCPVRPLSSLQSISSLVPASQPGFPITTRNDLMEGHEKFVQEGKLVLGENIAQHLIPLDKNERKFEISSELLNELCKENDWGRECIRAISMEKAEDRDELQQEKEEIQMVETILREEERKSTWKGKNGGSKVEEFFPTASPEQFPATSPTPLAEAAPSLLEGDHSSNSTQVLSPFSKARPPIPSTLSRQASFPPKNHSHNASISNSSFPPPFPKSQGILGDFPTNHNKTLTTSPKPTKSHMTSNTTMSGQSQPLTDQRSTPVNPNSPSPKNPPGPNTSKPGPSNPPPTSWTDIIKASSSKMELKFVKPSLNAKGFLTLGEGTSKEGEELWKNTLVGYSIDRCLPFKLVHKQLMGLWGKFGITDVQVNKEGFFFFTFKSEEGASMVLSSGPWIILGQQIFLKPWHRDFDFHKEEFKTIPNWIKLYGIPTTYWSSAGFSAIASHVGTPLYTDELTSSTKLLDFARICVEMKVGSCFPTSFKVQSEFDEEFEVRVEYSWLPRQCTSCNVFGHQTQACPKNLATKTKETNQTKFEPPNTSHQHKAAHTPSTTRNWAPKQHLISNVNLHTSNSFEGLELEEGELRELSLGRADRDQIGTAEVMEGIVDSLEIVEVATSPRRREVPSPARCGLEDGSASNLDKEPCSMDKNEKMLSKGKGEANSGKNATGPRGTISPEANGMASTVDSDRKEATHSVSDKKSPSPTLWGHKIRKVDEIERRNNKTVRKRAQNNVAKEAASKGSAGPKAPSTS